MECELMRWIVYVLMKPTQIHQTSLINCVVLMRWKVWLELWWLNYYKSKWVREWKTFGLEWTKEGSGAAPKECIEWSELNEMKWVKRKHSCGGWCSWPPNKTRQSNSMTLNWLDWCFVGCCAHYILQFSSIQLLISFEGVDSKEMELNEMNFNFIFNIMKWNHCFIAV